MVVSQYIFQNNDKHYGFQCILTEKGSLPVFQQFHKGNKFLHRILTFSSPCAGVTVYKPGSKERQDCPGIPELCTHHAGADRFFYRMGELEQLKDISFVLGCYDNLYDVSKRPEIPLKCKHF